MVGEVGPDGLYVRTVSEDVKSCFSFGVAKGAGIVLNYLSRVEENFGGNFFFAC